MWKWLKRPTNQKTLAFLSSGIAALAVAAWTAYTHFYPSKSGGSKPNVQAEGGVAAGGNIDVGRDLKIDQQNSSAEPAN